MEFLYHGSTTQDLKILEPRKRYTPDNKIEYGAIYATPLPAFAAAHAFPWSSDEGFDIDLSDGVALVVPEHYKDRLDVPISIYKLPIDNFQRTHEEATGLTWHATESVVISEEQKYKNVADAMHTLGGRIKFV